MGTPEEASKVATSAIDALKGNPGLLVLVFLQLTTLGVLYFVTDRQNERRAQREMAIIERCFPRTQTEKTASIRKPPNVLPLGRPDKE